MTSPLQADVEQLRASARLRVLGLPSESLRLVDGPTLVRVLDAFETRRAHVYTTGASLAEDIAYLRVPMVTNGPYNDALARVLDALEARTEALKWYADPKNNGGREFIEITDAAYVSMPKWRPIDDDEGETAREALTEVRHG